MGCFVAYAVFYIHLLLRNKCILWSCWTQKHTKCMCGLWGREIMCDILLLMSRLIQEWVPFGSQLCKLPASAIGCSMASSPMITVRLSALRPPASLQPLRGHQCHCLSPSVLFCCAHPPPLIPPTRSVWDENDPVVNTLWAAHFHSSPEAFMTRKCFMFYSPPQANIFTENPVKCERDCISPVFPLAMLQMALHSL